MERDPNVFLIGEDIGVYGGAFKVTAGMLDQFGERRVIDTPIAESAIVGAAIGASLMGLRPVVEMQFSDFITCAYDQIANFAAKCRYRWGAGVPIVIRAPSGGGIHGGPFHSQNPEASFVHTPGLKVVAPSTAVRRQGADQVRHPRQRSGAVLRAQGALPAHQGRSARGRLHGADRQGAVVREGRHLSIITYGAMVHASLEAADTLEKEGISVEVVDLRTLAPLDEETVLASVRKTSKVMLLHEDTLTGGLGGRDRGADHRERLRVSGWSDRAGDGAGYAGALQSAARGGVPAESRRRSTEKARWLARY